MFTVTEKNLLRKAHNAFKECNENAITSDMAWVTDEYLCQLSNMKKELQDKILVINSILDELTDESANIIYSIVSPYGDGI